MNSRPPHLIIPYLCGPIDGCTDQEANQWRDRALTVWPLAHNPMERDYRGKELSHYREIVELDKRDILDSHVVLANIPRPSFGTAMEVLFTWENRIPLVAWVPVALRISPWVLYHATVIVHRWDDAVAAVNRLGK